MSPSRPILRIAGLVLAASALVAAAAAATAVPGFDPDAPVPLSPEVPADVDPALHTALRRAGEPLLLHRLFERQQWAAFIALNWPVDREGRPRAALGDAGDPAWTTWIESYQVFRPDGAEPAPFGAPRRTALPAPAGVQLPVADATAPLPMPAIDARHARVIHDLSAIARVQVASEVDQAFSFAVWDQSGSPVHYEILLNKVQYDFIVQNRLYEAGGLADYMARNRSLTFPAGRFTDGRLGAMEVKLAWRILDPTRDDFGRYLVRPAYVPGGPGRAAWVPVTVGLVGFHIAQKTETAPQWIWSTFEHVDNLSVNGLTEITTADGARRRLRPSFNDPDCAWCPVNVPAEPGPDGVRRTQIARLSPIAAETRALNAIVRAQLARAGSKLAFYEMVGTQWPTDPEAPPQSGAAFPGAVTNMSGGKPRPVYLANSVMETFAQIGNAPAKAQPRATSTSERPVFGNGSCMGCHYSSPYDFSWIMTKAQPKPSAAPSPFLPSSP